MGPKVYISGKLHDKETARLSVFDHGLLFGDGVFEEMRSYSGRILKLAAHVDRLYASAGGVRLVIPLGRPELTAAIQRTLAENRLDDAYIRVIVTRGAGSLDLDPRKTTDPQLIIITDQVSIFPHELHEHGLKVITAATPRPGPVRPSSMIGSLSAQSNVLAKIEATAAGCLDALVLDATGEVAGCTSGNVFVVQRGAIHTPPAGSGTLDPIDREVVLELARAAGCGIVTRPLERYDVYVADECFLSGTAAGLIPVVECDGRTIGTGRPGPVTSDLRRRFEELIGADA